MSGSDPTGIASEPSLRPRPRTRTRQLSWRARAIRSLAFGERGLQLVVAGVVLGVWEYAGRQTPTFTFAPPSSVLPAARDMVASGELANALAHSLVALLIGFVSASVFGLGMGFAMGWWRLVGRTFDPFVAALYVVPIAALVPVIVVWFGLGLASQLIVIFLFAVFEILLNAYAGVKDIDPALIDVARTFGAGRRQILLKAVLPAALPFVFVGLRMGASRSVKGMVLAEILFAVTGLGGLIVKYANAFRMDRVLVVVIVIAALGIGLTAIVQAVERHVMRWRQAPRPASG